MVGTKEEVEEQKKKSEILLPKLRMMANMKFNSDKGLGKYLQCRRELVKAVRKHSRTGLGFKPELKSWDKKKKKVSFQIPMNTSIALENPEDLSLEEDQSMVSPWETPDESPESTNEVTPLFIPPPENFKPLTNQDLIQESCPLHPYSGACHHIPSFNTLLSVPVTGEGSTPAASENREDKQISLSLLSLLCDVREALQQLIFNGELDLKEIDLTQVSQHEDEIPVNTPKQPSFIDEGSTLDQVGG